MALRFFFADDSKQNNPSRSGMDPLVAIGGICVRGDDLYLLEQEINQLCNKFGFPSGTEFKWSPPKDNWMHEHLKNEKRFEFYDGILTLVKEHEVKAIVVIEETTCRPATGAEDPFSDATSLLLERMMVPVNWTGR